jgi:precorrin-6B methylase 2
MPMQKALVDDLRPGMTFYDLGANIGFFSLMAARLVGPQGRVVSFERVDPNTSPDRGLGHVPTNGSAPDTITVEAVSLDQYTASHPRPDFWKCDVEGAEGAVFQGAARLLAAKRPILLVEMHSPENHRALLDQFAAQGYRCQSLDDTHVLALPQ